MNYEWTVVKIWYVNLYINLLYNLNLICLINQFITILFKFQTCKLQILLFIWEQLLAGSDKSEWLLIDYNY